MTQTILCISSRRSTLSPRVTPLIISMRKSPCMWNASLLSLCRLYKLRPVFAMPPSHIDRIALRLSRADVRGCLVW